MEHDVRPFEDKSFKAARGQNPAGPSFAERPGRHGRF
jgi:hypothetical protein